MTTIIQATKALEALIAKARGGADREHIVFEVAEGEDAAERIDRTLSEMGIDPDNALVIQVEHLDPLPGTPAQIEGADLDDAPPVARPAPSRAPRRPPAILERLADDRNHDCFLDDDDCILLTHRRTPRRFHGSADEARAYLLGLSSW